MNFRFLFNKTCVQYQLKKKEKKINMSCICLDFGDNPSPIHYSLLLCVELEKFLWLEFIV